MAYLNEKQAGEVAFWQRLHDEHGHDGFLEVRRSDLATRTVWFPDLMVEDGVGLDYGCGCVSMFEFSGLDIDAYDPLNAEYAKVCDMPGNVTYTDEPDGSYDFIACFNVVDHDPDPTGLLDDVFSRLASGGRLYFMVNFDPELYDDCHYTQWNLDTVREMMFGFDLVRERVTGSVVLPGQAHYEAVYRRRA